MESAIYLNKNYIGIWHILLYFYTVRLNFKIIELHSWIDLEFHCIFFAVSKIIATRLHCHVLFPKTWFTLKRWFCTSGQSNLQFPVSRCLILYLPCCGQVFYPQFHSLWIKCLFFQVLSGLTVKNKYMDSTVHLCASFWNFSLCVGCAWKPVCASCVFWPWCKVRTSILCPLSHNRILLFCHHFMHA